MVYQLLPSGEGIILMPCPAVSLQESVVLNLLVHAPALAGIPILSIQPSPTCSGYDPDGDKQRCVHATSFLWALGAMCTLGWLAALAQGTPGGTWLGLACILAALFITLRSLLHLYRCLFWTDDGDWEEGSVVALEAFHLHCTCLGVVVGFTFPAARQLVHGGDGWP